MICFADFSVCTSSFACTFVIGFVSDMDNRMLREEVGDYTQCMEFVATFLCDCHGIQTFFVCRSR